MDDSRKAAGRDPAAQAEHLETLSPPVADAMRLILRIAGGDFAARGSVSERRDEIDAIIVGLNMLAESFQMERDLRARAESLLADALDAYEHAPGLFCSLDACSLEIVKSNETLARAVGLRKPQLLGKSLLHLCAPEARHDLEVGLRALLGGDFDSLPEVELLRGDGSPMTVALAGSVECDDAGRPLRLRLLLRDVTHERKLEEQLLHSQKMEAVGELAGGVAHDFNNMLLVIQTATSLLQRELQAGGAAAGLLSQVREASSRASDLTRQLLTFARRELSRPRVVDLVELVREREAVLRGLIGSGIELELRIETDDARARIDPARLEQALMNLVINARDAMPNGGAMVIVLAAAAHPTKPGEPGVRLSVLDTGHGIAPELRQRIFEPFFTTKPAGAGTGLGLATVYGIVLQAGGDVRVESEPGDGARFDLLFPRASAEGARAVRPPAATGAASPLTWPAGGREQVLVVDDEHAVRDLIVQVLREAGYGVLEVDSGMRALSLPPEQLDGVDLLISDVIMPGVPGPVLADRLRAGRPRLRCLLISGYPADHRIGRLPFLAKPFSPDQLLEQVRSTLDC